MTSAEFVSLTRFWVLLGLAGAASAQALSVERLQRLLQDAPHGEVRFTELRESRWLAAPVESSGTMRSIAGVLEKRVEHPRHETWRILDDRMEVSTQGSDSFKEIRLDDAPAAAALADALRRVMTGNLDALNKDFQLELSGDERDWTLRLTPRRQNVAHQIRDIGLQGTGPRLSVITILESAGDRTTTRLHYAQ